MTAKPNFHRNALVDLAPHLPPIRHMNQQQLARRLGVSCRTLERWRWTGVGPLFIKIEGRVKYRLADVEAYEQAHLCQSTADQRYFDKRKNMKLST